MIINLTGLSNNKIRFYQSTSLVVMQVDCCAWVVPIFQRVHKLFRDLLSKRHIITAASPYPPSATWGFKKREEKKTRTLTYCKSKRVFQIVEIRSGWNLIGHVCTCLSNSGVIAATVVKLSHTTVFGERVHHSRRTDGMDKRRLPCGYNKGQGKENTILDMGRKLAPHIHCFCVHVQCVKGA